MATQGGKEGAPPAQLTGTAAPTVSTSASTSSNGTNRKDVAESGVEAVPCGPKDNRATRPDDAPSSTVKQRSAAATAGCVSADSATKTHGATDDTGVSEATSTSQSKTSSCPVTAVAEATDRGFYKGQCAKGPGQEDSGAPSPSKAHGAVKITTASMTSGEVTPAGTKINVDAATTGPHNIVAEGVADRVNPPVVSPSGLGTPGVASLGVTPIDAKPHGLADRTSLTPTSGTSTGSSGPDGMDPKSLDDTPHATTKSPTGPVAAAKASCPDKTAATDACAANAGAARPAGPTPSSAATPQPATCATVLGGMSLKNVAKPIGTAEPGPPKDNVFMGSGSDSGSSVEIATRGAVSGAAETMATTTTGVKAFTATDCSARNPRRDAPASAEDVDVAEPSRRKMVRGPGVARAIAAASEEPAPGQSSPKARRIAGASAPTAVKSAATDRILRELEDIVSEQPSCYSAGPVDSDDLFNWHAVIMGPEGTPYEGGLFRLAISFPDDYPSNPPKVTFTTKIYHPNVSDEGDISLGALHWNWSPQTTVGQLLLFICCLLREPDLETAVNEDARVYYAQEIGVFHAIAKQWTEMHAF